MIVSSMLCRSAALAALALATTACQATGGGQVPSVDGRNSASFGMVFDESTGSFSGTFRDPGWTVGGVRTPLALRGEGVLRISPPGRDRSALSCLSATDVPYRSTTPGFPGRGTLALTFCDTDGNGRGNADDTLTVNVLDGPYTGYGIMDSHLLNGNIVVH